MHLVTYLRDTVQISLCLTERLYYVKRSRIGFFEYPFNQILQHFNRFFFSLKNTGLKRPSYDSRIALRHFFLFQYGESNKVERYIRLYIPLVQMIFFLVIHSIS